MTKKIKYVKLFSYEIERAGFIMFKIKIADTIFKINNIYSYVERLCRDYIYEGDDFDYEIFSTEELIDEEQKKLAEEGWSREYLENITVYRAIAMKFLECDAFVMHAAVIAIGDKAYAFTAKSGTGKSTHIRLWRKLRGEEVYVVNGDKPVMRFIDGKLYAYGTPWCGKEMWNTNTKAELDGICFLHRGEKNKIYPFTPGEASSLVIKQVFLPKDALGVIRTFDMVDKMLNITKLWKLECNISLEAAEVAYNAMVGGIYEN